jgi:hypothetical protein
MDFKSETNNSEQLSEADRSTGEEWQPEEIAAYLTEKEPEAVQQLADFLLSKGVDSTIGGEYQSYHNQLVLKNLSFTAPCELLVSFL